MNTFSNIFKKSFLEGFMGSDITWERILVTLFVTCVLALYIFLIYYLAAKKTFYSKTFNISLALISVITASIILAMQSNLVISLGMVGALSIVRFRTAIKDPMDLMFLFWAISIGIICGAQMYMIAVITSIVLTIGLFLLEKTPAGMAGKLLVVNLENEEAEREMLSSVQSNAKYVKVKSRNISRQGADLILEVKTQSDEQLLVDLLKVKGVRNVNLMEHDGEITL